MLNAICDYICFKNGPFVMLKIKLETLGMVFQPP